MVPLQVLCIITRNTIRNNTNKKPLLRKKSNVQKIYCGNDFVNTNYFILVHEQNVKMKDFLINKGMFKNNRSDHEVTSVNISSRSRRLKLTKPPLPGKAQLAY